MSLTKIIAKPLLIGTLSIALPALATTTYIYTDTANILFSGRFSVQSTLANGKYSFASAASQPTGFVQDFFTASFVDGRGVTRTPGSSLFDITIDNGQVSYWDIRATTTFTSVIYSGGKKYVPVYHDNSVLIYHDTNSPYTPGGGLAYQATIPSGDYTTYFAAGFSYQESLTGFKGGPGVWSIGATAVPEPETYILFSAGLGAVGFLVLRQKRNQS
jgi:hypothetical protein